MTAALLILGVAVAAFVVCFVVSAVATLAVFANGNPGQARRFLGELRRALGGQP